MLHQQAHKDLQEAALQMSAAGKPLSHAETTRSVLRESELSAHLSSPQLTQRSLQER